MVSMCIGASSSCQCLQHISRWISASSVPFTYFDTMTHFLKYTSRITSQKKWMVLERAEYMRFWGVRPTFSLWKLAKSFSLTSHRKRYMIWTPIVSYRGTMQEMFCFSFNRMCTCDSCLTFYCSMLLIPPVGFLENTIIMDKWNGH